MYRTMGRIHAEAYMAWRRLADDQRGQGTIEYVGLVMLMAVLLAGVVAAGKSVKMDEIPKAVAGKVKETLDTMKPGK